MLPLLRHLGAGRAVCRIGGHGCSGQRFVRRLALVFYAPLTSVVTGSTTCGTHVHERGAHGYSVFCLGEKARQ